MNLTPTICCKFEGHKRLFPLIFELCVVLVQNRLHTFFLHCCMADFLWNALFGIFGECWVCPRALYQFLLTSFVGFERRKEAKSLCQCAIYAIVWCIWLEHNSCIFNGRHSNKQVLWDRIRHPASTWCKAHDHFRRVSLLDM